MKHSEGYFKNSNNQRIYHQEWLPETEPTAVLLIIHGLHEHSGRYQHLAEFFTGKGYGVYGFDYIGHGKSDGPRSFVTDFSSFTEALPQCLNLIQERHANVPIYLDVHSLGGLIGAISLIDLQDNFSGAIFSGPLVVVPDFVSDLTLKMGNILSTLFPKLRLIGVDKDGLSRDPQVVSDYRNDPLVFTGKSTVRISSVINDGISYLAEHGSKITIPLLIMHGGQDQICNPSGSTYLHNLVSSQQNELIIYDELFHEIYNEPEQETVFNDLYNWLVNLTA